jgi:type IV pilus assembly protein PilB
MSDEPGGPALRAVPGGPVAEEDAAEDAVDGLTPPERSLSRSIPAVIAEMGFASREHVDDAIAKAKASGRPPEQELVDGGAISIDQLARATAQRFGLCHVDLGRFKIDLAALNLLSPQSARRLNAAPIGFADGNRLRVAISDPSNVIALDDLKLMTGHEVQPVVASPEDIQGLIGRMSRLDEAVAEAVQQGEAEVADVTEIRESADDAPVMKLVNSIIAQAVEDLASDIHFEPEGREMRVRFRVDGVLRETTHIPRRMVAGVVSRA